MADCGSEQESGFGETSLSCPCPSPGASHLPVKYGGGALTKEPWVVYSMPSSAIC